MTTPAQKRWRSENPERCREYTRKYRAKLSPIRQVALKKRNAANKLIWKRENASRYYESMKRFHLKRGYKMTLEEYKRRLVEQGYKCAICSAVHVEESRKRLHVDHCHRTKRNRALLCHDCNVMLGRAGAEGDDIEILKKAVAYLERFADFCR